MCVCMCTCPCWPEAAALYLSLQLDQNNLRGMLTDGSGDGRRLSDDSLSLCALEHLQLLLLNKNYLEGREPASPKAV